MKLSTSLLAIFIATFVLSSSACSLGKSKKKDWEKPEFCGKSECPPYEVREKGENYEERVYEAGKWVVTNVTETKYELAYTKAATKLMKYFKGSNEDEERIELTTPTLAALKLKKDATETERSYAFSMWLHPDYQDDAPDPNDEDVEIIDFPETTGFVRVFGGFATEATILRETNALHEELIKDEVEFDDDVIFVAVYDPAMKLMNRHNEVHALKKGQDPDVYKRTVVMSAS